MAYDDVPAPLCLGLTRGERLRRQRLDGDEAKAASRRAQALADPTRLTLAAALADAGELCVWDAAWVLERAQNLISHHLRALREAGLADTRREGRMVYYALSDEGRALVSQVLGGSVAATA